MIDDNQTDFERLCDFEKLYIELIDEKREKMKKAEKIGEKQEKRKIVSKITIV